MARPLALDSVTGGAAEQAERGILGILQARGLRAGDRLPPERELAERLGASRPVVREAISRLAAEGLVESRHGSGTYLAEVDVAAITHVRLLLEPEAAALAARARTEAELAELREIVGRLRASVDDRARFAELDARLHAVIAAACGNRVLVDVLARLARAAAVSRFVTSDSPRVRARAVRDLESLVSAVGRRRGEDARRAMQRHLGRLAGPAGEAPPSS